LAPGCFMPSTPCSRRFGLAAWAEPLDDGALHLWVCRHLSAGLQSAAGGASCLAPPARPADLFWLGAAWQGWLALFLLAAAVPTLLGFGLYNSSLIYLPSSVANLIVTLEPVFTAIIAFSCLAKSWTAVQILGSLLILAGVSSCASTKACPAVSKAAGRL